MPANGSNGAAQLLQNRAVSVFSERHLEHLIATDFPLLEGIQIIKESQERQFARRVRGCFLMTLLAVHGKRRETINPGSGSWD